MATSQAEACVEKPRQPGAASAADSETSGNSSELQLRPHNVHVHSYRSPHFCDFCGAMLFGLVKQGLKCDGCGLSFHKRCVFKLPNDCSGARLCQSPLQQASGESRGSLKSGRPLWIEKQLAERRIKVPHTFEIHSYAKPTICHHCKKLLYGLFRQGYQCKDCKYSCHKRCLSSVPKSCEGVLLPEESSEVSTVGSANVGSSGSAEDEEVDGSDDRKSGAPLEPMESANIPLMRVFQSIKQTRKHGASTVLHENWLVYYTDRYPEMKRRFWRLDARGITLHQDELTSRYCKEILLPEIVSVADCHDSAKDYAFAVKVVSGTVYFVGGPADPSASEGEFPADQLLLSRRQAAHFCDALRAALLPMSGRQGEGGKAEAAGPESSRHFNQAEVPHTSDAAAPTCAAVPADRAVGEVSLESRLQIQHEDILGSGQFGTVYGAVWLATGQNVAVKVIDKLRFPTKQETQLKNEVSILQSLSHEGVVKLHFMHETPRTLFVVMEKMSGDMLELILTSPEGRLPERETKYLVAQILCALRYLHNRCVVHCDLKPENVLLAGTGTRFPQIKLCDFGFARIIGEKSFRKSIVGTPAYLAPEVLKYKGYNRSIDMWSVGVITYVSLSGTFPFNEDEDIADQIRNASFMYPPEPWKSISAEAIGLISQLLQVKHRQRFSADKTLMHLWFQDYAAWSDLRKLEEFCHSRYLTDSSDDTRWELFSCRRGLPAWQDCGWNQEVKSPVYFSQQDS